MYIECVEAEPQLIQAMQNHLELPHLWICTTVLGASQRPEHRRDLRRSLVDYLIHKIKNRDFSPVEDISKGLSELTSLTDLSKRPETSFAKFSISHCPELGGFAIAPHNFPIGFDLEVGGRITNDIVLRISTADEVFESPNASSLWVAKESAYKSLPPDLQPPVLSQVRISNWKTVDEHIFGFSFEVPNTSAKGIGAVGHLKRLKLGLSVFQP